MTLTILSIIMIGLIIIYLINDVCCQDLNYYLKQERIKFLTGTTNEMMYQINFRRRHIDTLAKKYNWDEEFLMKKYYDSGYESLVTFELNELRGN